MKKIILMAGLIAGGVALSVTASANNWLLYLPAIITGSGESTGTPVTEASNKWMLFLPAILSQKLSQPPVVTGSSFNDTGITATVGSTGAEDADHGRDADSATNSDVDGYAGFSFTKLSADGTELAADVTSWVCVKDNVTGLVWEAKTVIEGEADRKTWTDAASVAASFSGCGVYSSCRLPTVKEFLGIVSYGSSPDYIDTIFFPNNVNSGINAAAYWTSTPLANATEVDPEYAWNIDFLTPRADYNAVSNNFYVRSVCE
ncbi:hypothetical protein KKHLCK_01495 [Candidatus Electrothrix laxa]